MMTGPHCILVYSQCGEIPKAISAYQTCGHWKKALYLAQSIDMEESELRKIARDIAESLMSHYSYDDASIVYDQYLDSPADAINASLTGGNFEEAMRLVWNWLLLSDDIPDTETQEQREYREGLGAFSS